MSLKDTLRHIGAERKDIVAVSEAEFERQKEIARLTKRQADMAEEQRAIEINTKAILPLLDITDARSLIREAQQIWGIGEVHESHNISRFLRASSASVSLSHSFLELENLYAATETGSESSPYGSLIRQSGVSLSISVHAAGGKGAGYDGVQLPYAVVSYNKYKKTSGVLFSGNNYARRAEQPWGPPASIDERIGQPLVYGLKWVDILAEDPIRTREGVEYQLALALRRGTRPQDFGLTPGDLVRSFVPREVKQELFPTIYPPSLPWHRRIFR